MAPPPSNSLASNFSSTFKSYFLSKPPYQQPRTTSDRDLAVRRQTCFATTSEFPGSDRLAGLVSLPGDQALCASVA
eukprot:9911664-Heterocapsa_arctica.AAC.1